VRGFFATGGRGLNVTIPHKRSVMALLDHVSERARRAGAVNTLALDQAAGLCGDNTDGVGLVRDLIENLRIPVRARRVLLLGAGGAARGVLGPLLELAPSELVIVNRSPDAAVALANEWMAGGPVRALGCSELAGIEFDLIINATAASLQGQLPSVPPTVLHAGSICYDMAYGRHDTPFVQWARHLGAAQAHLGLGMLVEQAAESFRLWRGLLPHTAAVLGALHAEGFL